MNQTTTLIRAAVAADASALCTIYNYYVQHTTVSFEEEPVSAAQMQGRIGASGLPWLVFEQDGAVQGYAYASPWQSYAVDASVFVAPDARRQKIGLALYTQLIEALRQNGVHSVVGGIAQPNPASVALHVRLGFQKVAHFSEVGRKHGRWIDVGYWQLLL